MKIQWKILNLCLFFYHHCDNSFVFFLFMNWNSKIEKILSKSDIVVSLRAESQRTHQKKSQQCQDSDQMREKTIKIIRTFWDILNNYVLNLQFFMSLPGKQQSCYIQFMAIDLFFYDEHVFLLLEGFSKRRHHHKSNSML